MSEKTDRRNAKLGFFVLISLVLFLIAIFFVGSARDMFNTTFEIHTSFKDVAGLTRGNNVRLSGVKIGTVRKVEIANDSMVTVTLKIRENDRKFINKDARALIGSDGLIGNTIVVIEPGHMGVAVEDGDTIAARTQTSAQDIMNTLENTGQNVLAITQDLQRITRQINSGEGTIGKLLSNQDLANNLETTVTNLEMTSQRSARISGNIAQMINQLQNNEDGLIHTLITDTTFSYVYDSLKLSLKQTSTNVARISGELEHLSNKLNNENNTLDVLLADSTFAKDLQRTMKNAAEGTESFNQNMEALQHHWLLRGFFRNRDK